MDLTFEVGALLLSKNYLGLATVRRESACGFNICDSSTVVKVIYPEVPKEDKYQVWPNDSCKLLKNNIANLAKKNPKAFIEAYNRIKVKNAGTNK